ncbi:MAG: hypothetical protein IT369_03530 [Candidatus Latescibacteria bacterium]|nr:hypothetical protein [Candidatus Latescibacterota bacterium]
MPKDLSTCLRHHTCLYASFDRTVDADFSRGNGTAKYPSRVVRRTLHGGHNGGALQFSAADYGWAEDEFTFPAEGNFPYSQEAFDGTIALWLSCDPEADLAPAYPVDPFHISRHPADGSFYLDFTRPDDERYGSPRKLRLGMYGDSPERQRHVGGRLLVVGDLGWQREEWHHVVATWRNVNSGQKDCAAEIYIDGVRRGWMAGFEHRLTWAIREMKIGIGQRYTGLVDEVLVLDRALSSSQIGTLFGLLRPVGDLL